MTDNATKLHLWYLDALRVIAIILVLFNHTGTAGFTLFTKALDSPFYFFYIAFACFDKVAVPIFFMVSGALLLGKEESVGKLLKKRVVRILIALLATSLIIYTAPLLWDNTLPEFSIVGFLQSLYTGAIAVPLWFLYAYLMYLLTLPLLRKIARALGRAEWMLLFCVYAAITLLPVLDFILFGPNGAAHTYALTSFVVNLNVFFPLMGYYIGYVLDESRLSHRTFAILAACALACIIAGAVLTDTWCASIDSWDTSTCEHFISTFVAMPAIALFYGMRLLFVRRPIGKTAEKVICTLGGAAFGIYLAEAVYRNTTMMVYTALIPYLHSFISSWVWILVAWALGTAVTLVLKRIPGVNKIL